MPHSEKELFLERAKKFGYSGDLKINKNNNEISYSKNKIKNHLNNINNNLDINSTDIEKYKLRNINNFEK